MADLEDITVTSRGDETDEPTNGDPPTRIGKRVRRRKRKNSSGVDSANGLSSGCGQHVPQPQISRIPGRSQSRGDSNVDGNGEQAEQPAVGQKKDLPPTTQDYQARFYEIYREEAKDHDKEFTKKYDGDLNTTLIFAGLFSVVTSAFIIEINSELKPDPNEETAALLRVLIHKVDNTTFGGDVPAVPQWTGPPRTVVHVQAILFASLAASIFSAFLAMLGKQWLNRYASADVRGSTIERGQNRQRKFDGIVAWYFDHVMESLPLILQAALLLHGCALSRYLWEINTTVASVVIGVTSFGVLIYLFIVVAGAASVSCPYQTPGAHILRRIFPEILGTLRPVFSNSVEKSLCRITLNDAWNRLTTVPHTPTNINIALLAIFLLPVWFLVDVCRATVWLLVVFSRRMRLWSRRGSKLSMATLDLRCISWTLRTSPDGPVRLATLNHLTTTTLADFDPTLVADCFDTLTGYVKVIDEKAVIAQGTEQLAPAAALCCLRTLSHLTVTDPMLSALGSLRQQYDRAFPPGTDFGALSFSHTLGPIHMLLHPEGRVARQRFPRWEDYKPSSDEHVTVAHALVRIARFWRRQKSHEKVPRCLLRFVLHSLSRSPLPSTAVIVDCLLIVAIDLDCDSSNTATSDESVSLDKVFILITQKLDSMVEDPELELIHSKRKAISSLFPYAVFLEQGGQRRMVDAISRTARATRSGKFMWHRVQPFIAAMFDKPNPPSLNWVLGLISPRVPWDDEPRDKNMVARRAATTLTVSYPEEDGWSVTSELLRIAFIDSLHPNIPHGFPWQPRSTGGDLTDRVRALGDIGILKSYLLLIWSKWGPIGDQSGSLAEMQISVREDFGGIGMGHHRADLVEQLDYILQELSSTYHMERKEGLRGDVTQRKEQCEELKRVLLEVDGEAANTLTRSHRTFVCALPPPHP